MNKLRKSNVAVLVLAFGLFVGASFYMFTKKGGEKLGLVKPTLAKPAFIVPKVASAPSRTARTPNVRRISTRSQKSIFRKSAARIATIRFSEEEVRAPRTPPSDELARVSAAQSLRRMSADTAIMDDSEK